MTNAQDRQTILVVEDDPVSRILLAGLFENEHRVILASTGAQALEKIQENPRIDLILLDIVMPDVNGYEVLQRLKQDDQTRHIPVVFITSLAEERDEERGLELGASDYITKPLSPTIVRVRVKNLLSFVRQRKLLETLAGRDGLTEIPNRRSFDETLVRECARHRRNRAPLSVAMIDVDLFKEYNDTYGHAKGDAALKSIARTLTQTLRRPADFVARYGGEEFAVILPDTAAAEAQETTDRFRTNMAKLAIPHETSPVAPWVTISIGGYTASNHEYDPKRLIELADANLYTAKQQGRDRGGWSTDPTDDRR